MTTKSSETPTSHGGGTDSLYLRALLECNPLAIVVLRADGSISDCNRAFEELFGHAREEVIDSSLDGLIVPEKYREEAQSLTARARAGEQVVAEVRRLHKDGHLLELAMHGVEVRIEDEHAGVFAIYEDISERKRAQAELRAAMAAAEEATLAKSAFLANMSHEIRTPMNAIIGMSELALETKLDPEQREYVQTVRDASESLLSLIDGILDFSKIEAGKLELEPLEFRLRDCVENAVKTLAVRARQKGLEMAIDFAADVPDAVVGDAVRLRQIVVNLVGNAIKFTERGEVELRVRLDAQEEDEVALRFTVRDTGIGIAADKLEAIFESFSQADVSTTREFGGTGLGLAISSQLAERMGGRMWVDSVLGEGTSFHFIVRLGLQEDPVENPRDGIATELADVPALIVDDNETNRRILLELLEGWGLAAFATAGAEEAMAILSEAHERGEPFSVVLLDGCMPGIDGFALAEQIMKDGRFDDLALMMLTSAGIPGDGARCRDLGIASYLTKPVPQTDLWDALCTVLGAAEHARPRLVTRHSLREARRPINVLLAEDNPVNVKLAVRLLEKRGHQVDVASNGQEAIDLLEKEGPFDVVLMDVQMPVMDGLEATALIRSRELAAGRAQRIIGRQRIIGVTAHAMEGDRQRCIDAGMDGYLSKPFSAKDLFALIED